jgi:MFS family permease
MRGSASKFGPVRLEEDITPLNIWTLMFAAFVSIGLVTGMATMTPYILSTNLGIAEDAQGSALGRLALWQELALILCYGPLGLLADRWGRQIVYALGFATLAIGYAVFPYATSLTELSVARLVYAVGIGAVTGMLATVVADYGVEADRGKLTAICGFLNGLGVVLVALFIGKLPAVFVARGASDIDAGRATMLVAAGFCVFAALVAWAGLKRGVPKTATGVRKKPALEVLREGFALAGRSPRIAVAYASGFAARGDVAIVGLFAIAWGKQAAVAKGMSMSEALSAGLVPFIVAQSAALCWPAVIAVPLDRLPRMTALGLSMMLGAIGYCALWFVDDPLAGRSLPLFALLGIGQISAFLAAQTIIGKEAPSDMRGSVIGVFNFCGAIGILVLSVAGGWLFDAIGPWAPFFLVGIVNGVVAIAAFLVRRREQHGPITR